MPCRFASSGTVATSRSASRAILALNVASNFLRDLVISVLHRLRQSRTRQTLTFGPSSGVHFSKRENKLWIRKRRGVAMENVRRHRAMGSLCRQSAVLNPLNSWKLLGDTERWEHLAEVEIALHFKACNTTSSSDLGACPNSRCSIVSESDSTLGHEQVFSPLEYRSDAAFAAECAGLRAERPCLPVYR